MAQDELGIFTMHLVMSFSFLVNEKLDKHTCTVHTIWHLYIRMYCSVVNAIYKMR